MRELELKVTGNRRGLIVSADGEELPLKKDNYANAHALFKTEKDRVTIEVYRYADVGGFVWFILQLLFFLVSIFGIFDARRGEKCFMPECVFEAELSEKSKITLKQNVPRDGAKAFDIAANVPVKTQTNAFYFDRKKKKILKGLLAAKIVLAIGGIAGIVVAVLHGFGFI